MTVLEYGEDMIVVDCGLGFPEDDMYGVDLVMPDVTYLDEEPAEAPRLLHHPRPRGPHRRVCRMCCRPVNAPVHATPLTLGLVKLKLEEHDLL